ncbi:MAG: carbonic anhydrase [Bdellovibrio sp.]|nr:MAG: carbonic anhydrase [Bdellovibrio sp.]
MKKLVKGILDFRQRIRRDYHETFARLALGQSPDALFIACSDSRVAPNVFASTDPGDLFVIRNVGNLVPVCGGDHGHSTADESEAAAIEFAIHNLKVSDIIVCGHSECGAMQALLTGREKVETPNLRSWLRHGENALRALGQYVGLDPHLATHNRLSQLNVLQQVENLKSYPIVQDQIAKKKLRIHAWWFELAGASVNCFDPNLGRFVELDEEEARAILESDKFPRSMHP